MVHVSGLRPNSQLKPRPNPLSKLPWWISRWLGYRANPPSRKLPEWGLWIWTWIGAFCGISVVQAVFSNAHYFITRGTPSIVASYGASAVLIYGTIESPLAQPRALIGGHFLGALTGIILTKLFLLLPTEQRYVELQWLPGSMACATSSVIMQITGTNHPPAVATALLAAIDVEVRELGWYYLPIVLLSSTLALGVALFLNNIQRRYPVVWFTPDSPPSTLPLPNTSPISMRRQTASSQSVDTLTSTHTAASVVRLSSNLV